MSLILKQIIEATKLPSEFCAELIGVVPEQLEEWLSGARPLPRFVVPELSSILGVAEKAIVQAASDSQKATATTGSLAPAIWYKLRDAKLTQADREMVALVRKLGFYLNQLGTIRGVGVRRFEPLLRAIRDKIDRNEPPALQGRAAAHAFRSMTDLHHGQTGVGEWVRPTLRNLGVLVVESPLKSAVEGCAFAVGSEAVSTPCVFANSYRSTWFRRNAIIMHEVGHVIFDLENEQVSVDYKDEGTEELKELRAQAFAQESLVPVSVLNSATSRHGIKWSSMSAEQLALLIAGCHVEQKLILKAAFEYGFISQEERETCEQLAVDVELRRLSPHALSTREYLQSLATQSPKWIAENRNTDLGRRSLRLPSTYVSQVIDALQAGEISEGKAAEMMMVDKHSFRSRFSALLSGEIVG